jgi:hypothetical protein
MICPTWQRKYFRFRALTLFLKIRTDLPVGSIAADGVGCFAHLDRNLERIVSAAVLVGVEVATLLVPKLILAASASSLPSKTSSIAALKIYLEQCSILA